VIIKAHLELVKDTRASEDVESHSKALRESYRYNYLMATDLQKEFVEIGRNKTPVANNDHLATTLFPVDTDATCLIDTQDAEGAPESTNTQSLWPSIKTGIIGIRYCL